MKTFIAITAEIYQGKLVLIQTSTNKRLYDPDGISTIRALDFLFNLRHKTKKGGVVFVCYAFSRDNEFIFSVLSNSKKDKLFKSYTVRKQLRLLEHEQEILEEILYNDKEGSAKDLADFELYVNQLSKEELQEVKVNDYFIELMNSKKLIIRKGRKSITIYDLFSFFRKPLKNAVNEWLGDKVTTLIRKDFLLLNQTQELTLLQFYAQEETKYLVKLAQALQSALVENGIKLGRYHGSGAVASWILSQSKARKEFYNYRYKRQLSPELYKAVQQSFFAGRTEQFKIGTLNNIYIYDINSAYAFACTFLPKMKEKPKYIKEWIPAPFSIWYCEYDFTQLDLYFGLLPNREIRGNFTRYKTKGKGYFWQPEISFILQHYPQCIKITHGFILPYMRANFTNVIENVYKLRVKLQHQKHPLEKILKLALASLYGKFCQHQGKGYYYNLFYAGFITSFVRAMLLRATVFQPESVICFQTDSIHTLSPLRVNVNNDLGSYKVLEVDTGMYLDLGVYRSIVNGCIIKEKTRGFNTFDFDKALTELRNTKTYNALIEYFVGYNLHSLHPLNFQNYLGVQQEVKHNKPLQTSSRLFEDYEVDLTRTFIDSQLIKKYAGVESALYQPKEYKDTDFALDTIRAQRIKL